MSSWGGRAYKRTRSSCAKRPLGKEERAEPQGVKGALLAECSPKPGGDTSRSVAEDRVGRGGVQPGLPSSQHSCRERRSLTSAVGKRGTANCSRPTTWICMVVSERWKAVNDWVERPQPPMRIHSHSY